jgi:beta-glucosidase
MHADGGSPGPATAMSTEAMPDGRRAPTGFLWGAATSAYQIEGAATEDGRGPSIWDTFSRIQGAIRGGDTGDEAADHYHRMADDVAMMADMRLRSYRFSVAWPRIQPDGEGAWNEAGMDFYRRLVDHLLAADIVPFVTLYHWDLPQRLQDRGGWPRRDLAYRFADYAAHVFEALGDRVPFWATINEPWCAAFLGYGSGVHAPGIVDPPEATTAAHHLLLAHGLAVQAIRAAAGPKVMVGIVLDPQPIEAASQQPADLEAARRVDGMRNRLFLDPILRGHYPPDVLDDLSSTVDLGFIRPGDEPCIATPIDVLGINYYRPTTVAATPDDRGGDGGSGHAALPPWPGAERAMTVAQPLPRTAMGWEIRASSLRDLLVGLRRAYGDVPLFVTENGAAYEDSVGPDGVVDDRARIDYLDQHIRAALEAVEAGVDLRGFFVWSLLDNFEWSEGYARRFGLVYVDYPTQRRILKSSAHWYRQVIREGGPTDATLRPRAGGAG